MIGGNFALDPKIFLVRKHYLHLADDSVVWLQSGRSALALLIKLLKLKPGDEVFLPAYHCEEMVKPFMLRGINCVYYPVEENLQISLAKIVERITPKTKLILYVPYLGFRQKKAKAIQAWCRQNEIALVEDNIPMTPEKIKVKPTTFQIFGFRKAAGVPSGAVLVLPKEQAKNYFSDNQLKLSGYKRSTEFFKLSALVWRWFYQLLGLEILRKISYKCHRLGEDLLDDQPRKISCLSRFMAERTDWNSIAQKRRANAAWLIEQIKTIPKIKPVVTQAKTTDTPLFLPIYTSKAKALKKFLLDQGVYSRVDWKWPRYMSRANFATAYRLANQTVYLTIDQRCQQKQLNYQLNKIKEFFSHD